MEQGSPEWLQARCGSLGASSIADATAKTKTGWGASRANLKARLVAERLTGTPQDSYSNAAMAWGNEQEPLARFAYEFHSNVDVEQVAIVPHPMIEFSHASPDGLVGANGLVEIKCPNTATHITTLLGTKIDAKYLKQMQWQMACTGRAWCDFVSFDPRLPAEMQISIERVQRNQDMILELEAQAKEFLAEVDETVSQLRAKYKLAEAA